MALICSGLHSYGQIRKLADVSTPAKSELFRLLPSVDEALHRPALQSVLTHYGHVAVAAATRSVLDQIRLAISSDRLDERGTAAAIEELPSLVEQHLSESLGYSLRPVINATGVILHTNLGRAPLSDDALRHVSEVAQGYSNLEFDLDR